MDSDAFKRFCPRCGAFIGKRDYGDNSPCSGCGARPFFAPGIDNAMAARLNDFAVDEANLRAAAREALDVLTRLADSASEWQVYALPAGIVSEVDAAKARLAGVLRG